MKNDNEPKRITYTIVDRTAVSLAAREMNLEEIVRKYKLLIRKMMKKTNMEPDLVRDDKDRIN